MIKKRIDNSRFPHHASITREAGGDNFTDAEKPATVLYDGCCHLFHGSRGSSDKSFEADRIVSIPVRFDEWEETPNVNDHISVAVNGTMVNEGLVTDVLPDNNRTQVYFKMKKL